MPEQAGQRLDRWLWFARIVKTRTLASRLVSAGKVRVNRERVARQSRLVKSGDVITAAIHGRIRVLKVLATGERRGPASEAQALYEDMSPPAPLRTRRDPTNRSPGQREKGAGRPTKRERRKIEEFMERSSANSE